MRPPPRARWRPCPLVFVLLALALIVPLADPAPSPAAASRNTIVDPPLVESVVAGFADIPYSYWAWQHIQALYARGITQGCDTTPLLFCPEASVTRAQMAVFLVRASHGVAFAPPAPTGHFGDVPPSYWAAAWIEQLAADGVTSGCSLVPAFFCPEASVTRAEMAVFLVRAIHGLGFVPPPATGVFVDVEATYWAAGWIEQLATDGVTSGCNLSPARYCPETSVTRAQMAVFLVRTFDVATPNPVLTSPTDGVILSTGAVLAAGLQDGPLSAFDIGAAHFEYSTNGTTWTPIWSTRGLFEDFAIMDLNQWDALWKPDTLPGGEYLLRLRMETLSGRSGTSAARTVTVNKPPTAVATLVPLAPVGDVALVLFSAESSSDLDGAITSCRWQVGGAIIGPSCTLPQNYPPVSTPPIPLILTVFDNRGAMASSYYEVEVSGGAPPSIELVDKNDECVCEKMELRATGEATGDDGVDTDPPAADSHWPARANTWDGATLGPLDGNPANPAVGGEQSRTGIAFEIVCTVKGNPAKCRETQLVKATFTINGVVDGPPWSGASADRDLDGTSDLKADTKKDCEDHGGVWDGKDSVCRWPQGGTKYRPDTPEDGPSLYDSPYAYKAHVGDKILWFDAPGWRGGANGSTLKADFVAIVRGTDGKYCYKVFSVDLERQAGKDKETLTVTGGADGAASVPGVP